MVHHTGSEKKVKLSNSHKLFGQEREIVEEGFAGDIVGLVGHSMFRIGDTLTEDPSIAYQEIPRFPPECFAFIYNPIPSKYKQFRKGLDQLLSEGVVQAFNVKNSLKGPLLAAVGPLQFEVVQYRLQSEYGADAKLEMGQWQIARWIDARFLSADLAEQLPFNAQLATDQNDNTLILFPNEWSLNYLREKHPDLVLYDTPPSK